MTLRTVTLCLLALLFAVACVPSDEEEEVSDYRRDTTMGEIQKRDVLVIGVEDGLSPVSTAAGGFVFAYAQFIAESLGVEVLRVETGSAEELLARVDEGELDLALPLVPVTEKRVRQNTFTDPYFISHQRLLVPPTSSVTGVDDLGGKRVCSFVDEDVGVSLDSLDSSIDVIEATAPAECLHQLEAGEVAAVTASEIFLIPLDERLDGARIVGEQLTTEGYAAAVTKGDSEMAGFVSATLGEYKSEGHWLTDFESLLAEHLELEDPHAPELTLEEAATLFPKDVPAG